MSNEQNPISGAAQGQLDPVEMNEMISFYANNIAPVLTKLKNTKFPDVDQNIQDATSAWISFAALEKFISDNKATGNADGVRIYYGIHIKDSFPGDPTKNQKGLHNIIFVPTTSGGQTPSYMNSRNIVEVGVVAPEVRMASEVETTGTGYALDNMALCPPNC